MNLPVLATLLTSIAIAASPTPTHKPRPSPIPSASASAAPQASSSPSPTPSPSLSAAPGPALSMTQIDDLLQHHRTEETSIRLALSASQELLKKNPKDAQAGWRAAMAAYLMGFKFTPGDDRKDEREKLYRSGVEFAENAIDADEKCAPCHFWAGVHKALIGESVGPFKMLSSIGQIRRHAEKSAELDPSYVAGGAYRLLGQLESGLPGILGGSDRRAQEWFEKAVSVSPKDPINYPWLIRILRKRGKDDEARQMLAKANVLEAPPAHQVESKLAVEDLKQLTEELKKK